MKKDKYFVVAYDQFPFMCVHKLEKVVKNGSFKGRVEMVGAPGYYFKPIKFLSEKKALKLKEELNQITTNRSLLLKSLNRTYNDAVEKIKTEYSIKDPEEIYHKSK